MRRRLVEALSGTRRSVGPAVVVLVLTAIVVGPMSRLGWVVALDWVSGPRVSYWSGLGDRASLPAGPLFFAGAAAAQWATGAAVGWLMPALALLGAGLLAARTGAERTAGRVGAAAFAVWNPFVHERLYAGQPAMLAGYAALFGLAACARGTIDANRPIRLAAWWSAAAACSVQFAVLGGMVLLALDAPSPLPADRARSRRRELATASALTAAVTACWLALSSGAPPAAGEAVALDAFATRADPRLGLALGTLVQRGFWRAAPAAPGLWGGGAWQVVAVIAALVPAGLGWWCCRRRQPAAAARLLVVAASAWVLSWGAAGPAGPLFRWAVTTLPGAGAFREPGKFLAVLSVLTAVLVGTGLDRAAGWGRSTGWASGPLRWTTPALAVALAVATTPSLAWGVGGRLAAVRYPADWQRARDALGGAAPGSVLVLPRWAYLDPGFTGGRIVSDPARAFFGDVIRPGGDAAIPGLASPEASRQAAAALDAGDGGARLAELGIDWVLVLRPLTPAEAPGFEAPEQLGLQPVLSGSDLALWQRRTPPAAAVRAAAPPPTDGQAPAPGRR